MSQQEKSESVSVATDQPQAEEKESSLINDDGGDDIDEARSGDREPPSQPDSPSVITTSDVGDEDRISETDKEVQAEKVGDDLLTAADSNDELLTDDDDDDIVPGNPSLFTPVDRSNIYRQGIQFRKAGKKKKALKCFLAAIKDLSKTNGCTFLPQCLRMIADSYFEGGEYEKAIQFVQAEKMYYETAIIDTSTLQRKLENPDGDDEMNESERSEKPETIRAEEYEKLAKMCLDKRQPQLALEYQGKATKLRQQIYGEDHPLTAKSLDFFTVLYAEVGKQQYSDSMQKFGKGDVTTPESNEDNSGVRKRTVNQSERPEILHTDPVEEQIRRREQEEYISRVILWVFFFVSIVILSIILFYIKIDLNNRSCAAWKNDIHYYYMRFKYFFYTYFVSPSKASL